MYSVGSLAVSLTFFFANAGEPALTVFEDTNSVAYISGTAGVDWGCAVMVYHIAQILSRKLIASTSLQILAAASIGSDGAYVPTTGQT